MVQLGWKAGPEQFPPAELLDYAVAADKAGFDSIDVSDHFNPWSEAGQAAFTWTWLGAVAARTNRIHMGTGVTCPILRYHPAVIAQAAATLTHLAPGRVYLGVGTGEALNEYAATGEWPEYEERQEMLAEAIDLIRALWSGEEVSFDGAYYTTRKAKLYTPPTSPIPIYVSALVPNSAKFAGQYGDGLFTVGGKKPDLYKQIIKNFEDSASEAGKDPAQMPRLIELNVEYTDELDSAIEYQLKYWAGAYIPALFNQKIYTPAMSQENGEIVGADALKKGACISSNADDHVKFAQQYIDLGFDRLFFHSALPNQDTFIERFASDVLPRLR
ncbi:MAG: TIGR03557 family F420-dependent LLM class oxidoreductase [Ktedonobacteraceae bacterium]